MLFPSVILNKVSATRQGTRVLNDVSFTLLPGEHLAILGASGSGKTTLAKALAKQVFANGVVEIRYSSQSQFAPKTSLIEQRYQFKNLSNVSDFYYQQRFNSFDAGDAYTVLQELQQVAATQPGAEANILEWLNKLGLYHRKDAPVIQLSSGEHKRFQLIKGLLAPPQLLILDTPFVGLDKAARRQLHQIINNIAAAGTQIIMITGADEISSCITHIAYLEQGKLKAFDTKPEFDFSLITPAQHHHFDLDDMPLSEEPAAFEYAVWMKNVTVRYGEKTILDNINWQVKKGEKWLVRGHNGAGKSTLLSLINGDNPQAYNNEIYLFDKRRGSGESIWDIKQKTGYISPELHAFFDKNTTCFNAIASGLFDAIGLFRKLSAQQQAVVQHWIHFFKLTNVQHKLLSTVSSGTQRMVLLARAMIKNPALLILDEPCQGLDDEQKDSFISLVNDLCAQMDTTLIYVSHYEQEIPAGIHQVLELEMGKQKMAPNLPAALQLS